MSWKSYQSSWQIKYRPLRFRPGQSERILIVGDPWTFQVKRRGERHPATRHLCDVLVYGEDTLRVFEINDNLFNRIRSASEDPRAVWL